MMKTHSLFLLIILSTGLTASGQQVRFGFQTGIGFYAMNELKELNPVFQEKIPFKTNIVSDFPPYFFYQPSVLFGNEKFRFGFLYSFNTTGSRISAKDYSGEYRVDMTLNGHSAGVQSELDLYGKGNVKFSIYAKTGITFNNLKINEYFAVSDSVLIDELSRFKCITYFLEPGMKLEVSVKQFAFELDFGYCLQPEGTGFHEADNPDKYLRPSFNGDPVIPQWNGSRIGLTVSYKLIRKV
jgi:hypothetical protein